MSISPLELFEILSTTLKYSETIPILSLIVAFLAYRHTIKSSRDSSLQIHKIAYDHQRLIAHTALNQASQKYVALVRDTSKEFDAIIEDLSRTALESNQKIRDIFDKYDLPSEKGGHLRHAIHQCATIVEEAYDLELTYQKGLNLIDRLRWELRGINREDILSIDFSEKTPLIKKIFQGKIIAKTPEEYIHQSDKYWNNIYTLYSKIPESKESDIFNEVLKVVAAYSKKHKNYRDTLKGLEERLKDGISENDLELFKIQDISPLWKKYKRLKSDINIISEFHFPDFYQWDESGIEFIEGISLSLYSYVILYIVSQRCSWGIRGVNLYLGRTD